MTTSLMIDQILQLSESNRPVSFAQYGLETHNFRRDFDNVIVLQPGSDDTSYVYLDKYGHKATAAEWTASQYAQVVLSHWAMHDFIDGIKKLKSKGTSLPDYLYQIANHITEVAPLPEQTALDKNTAYLINVLLLMDIIKDQNLDEPLPKRAVLNNAVIAAKDTLKAIFPDFDEFAEKAYRDLGYFELDPFSKRITTDHLNRIHEEQPNKSLTAIYELSVGHIYKDTFGPRLAKLSITQRQIIDFLVRNEGGMEENKLLEFVSGEDHAVQSAFRQELAELIERKALSSDEGVLKVRGDEFNEWYWNISAPRRRHARPEQAVGSGPSSVETGPS